MLLAAPRLLFTGTCQNLYLSSVIQKAAPGLDVGFIADEEAARAQLGPGGVLVGQARPFDRVARGGDEVRAPVIMLSFLWPRAGQNEQRVRGSRRYTPTVVAGAGLIDEDMRACVTRARSPAEAIARYLATDVPALARVDRLRRLNMAQMEAVCRSEGLAIHELVESRFQSERLFQIFGHPMGRIMHAVLDHLFDRLAETAPAVADRIDMAAARLQVSKSDGMHQGRAQAPVHPTVANHFALTWTESPQILHRSLPAMTNRQYCELLIRTEYTYRRISHPSLSTGELEAIIEEAPPPPLIGAHMIAQLWARNDEARAQRLVDRWPEFLAELPVRDVGALAMSFAKARRPDVAARFADHCLESRGPDGGSDHLARLRKRLGERTGRASGGWSDSSGRAAEAIAAGEHEAAAELIEAGLKTIQPRAMAELFQALMRARRADLVEPLLESYLALQSQGQIAAGTTLVRLERIRLRFQTLDRARPGRRRAAAGAGDLIPRRGKTI